MADSIASSLANILGYIWTLLLAFFVGQTTSVQPELPLGATGRGSSRAQVQRSSEYRIETDKDQFLRHPSLSSKRKGRQKDTNTEIRSKQYTLPCIFPPGSSSQYLNSFAHRPTTIPVVIVTPSTPTSNTSPVAEPLLPSLSTPLQLSDATVEPPHPLPTTISPSIPEDTDKISSAPAETQVSIPPNVEYDISDIEFDSWTTSVAPASLGGEAAEPSFFLPESLQKITFEPIRCASDALSAVSSILYDVPVWSDVEAPGIKIPTYFTSTPPRQRRPVGTKLQDIENNYVGATVPLDSPTHDAFHQDVDHVPYPDVFDLDMYYDISLSKKFRKSYSRDHTFTNTPSLESDGLTDSPLGDDCQRIAVFSVISGPSHEHEHDSEPCLDDIHQSPSTRSNLASSLTRPSSPILTQSQHQITPLSESTNWTTTTSAMTSPSSTLYSIAKSTAAHVKSQHELIRSVTVSAQSSNHGCQRPSDLEPESDAGSMDALNARLREDCGSFSTPLFTEGIEIWEPVSF